MNAPLAGRPDSIRQRLEAFMAEVLRQHALARKAPETRVIHDLRVGLRRCLSVSTVMRRIDGDGDWAAMHRRGRQLFRRLGRLRDLQVQVAWVRHFDPEGELWTRMERGLLRDEELARAEAQRAIRRWRRGRWKRWSAELPPRLDRLEAEPAFLLRMAVVQLGRAQALHRLPLGGDRSYHQLRIELKRFRYFLEAFLPAQHGEFIAELKSVQDLLGDAHDLDALEDRLAAEDPDAGGRRRERSLLQISAARRERFDAYAALSEGSAVPLWPRWRGALLAELAAAGGRLPILPGGARPPGRGR